MRCLIVAAGRGSRLASRAEPKPLVPLLGLPLLERVVRTAREAGVTECCVVTGHRGEEVRRFLAGLSSRLGVPIRTVDHPGWEAGNGSSVLAGRPCVGEGPFLLLMADHLMDPAIPQALVRAAEEGALAEGEGADLLLAVDTRLDNPAVDPADVTRVRLRGERILAIGKGLEGADGYDTGAFLCGPGLFAALEEALAAGEGSLSAAVQRLAARGRARALDLRRAIGDEAWWVDVDDEAAFRRAEALLLERLRAKANDGPVSRWLNRPLSIRLTRRLAAWPLTPNQLSVAVFLLSVLAAWLLARPGYAALAAGGLLAQAASVLDGCDGELARLRHQRSDFGGWLDAVLDRYADALLLGGLAWHAYRWDGAGEAALLWGFAAVAGSFVLSYTADKYDGLMRARVTGTGWRLGRDLRVLLVAAGALLHLPLGALALTALLMNAEVLRRILVARRAAAGAGAKA
ncbi:MAG: di-myo-inositol-1,3'-phosphate-1'-phosphate synthase [Gammaproteobacteria bacterium]|nr:MAG: di-myo-inositol-1,3'-phosphate-1'-phosphate synthase [Gammaproteobacteria bacterium]